ncbi:MAG: IS110 family transposase [bacterium]|nr:IS110 family transposase [bacterium]
MEYLGIEVHSKYSEVCGVSEEGEVTVRRRVPTTETALRRFFGPRERSKVTLESGPVTPWVYRLLCELGHDVTVVNPRRVRLIAESTLKTDGIDAEVLARLSRLDLGLLRPVYQRTREAQELRTRLRVRTSLVKARTSLINAVRGTLRAQGYRVPSCPAKSFVVRYASMGLDSGLSEAIDPLVTTIGELTDRINGLEKQLVAESSSNELLVRLQTVPGVGPLVSLAFLGWMDRPDRFQKSRDVGPCLGLRPSLRSSGGHEIRGRITREGDTEMRRLLVQAAHAALSCRKDSSLKLWGESLVERLGKSKAVVALARKIGVLLHRLWVTGESFRAFPQAV